MGFFWLPFTPDGTDAPSMCFADKAHWLRVASSLNTASQGSATSPTSKPNCHHKDIGINIIFKEWANVIAKWLNPIAASCIHHISRFLDHVIWMPIDGGTQVAISLLFFPWRRTREQRSCEVACNIKVAMRIAANPRRQTCPLTENRTNSAEEDVFRWEAAFEVVNKFLPNLTRRKK